MDEKGRKTQGQPLTQDSSHKHIRAFEVGILTI